MEVRFKYFGMIAEQLGRAEEMVDLPENVSDVRAYAVSKHPFLRNMSFIVAIDQEINDTIPMGAGVSEVALFPPFAGG